MAKLVVGFSLTAIAARLNKIEDWIFDSMYPFVGRLKFTCRTYCTRFGKFSLGDG
jgi:hypothetical protein